MKKRGCGVLLAAVFLTSAAWAGEVRTNAVEIPNAPSWVTSDRVDKIVDRIQTLLEWDIRRINVVWYSDEAAFEKMHGYGPTVLAVSRKSDNTVHVGPRVTDANFDAVFGHELVHVISFQKYKGAIPLWLEEGLANYLAKQGTVDYAWMAKQPAVGNVHDLLHPFNGSADHIRYTYMASHALVEMIASKCDLSDLLQMSVGKKLETYLSTLCGISDLNGDFKTWIDSRSHASK